MALAPAPTSAVPALTINSRDAMDDTVTEQAADNAIPAGRLEGEAGLG